MIASVFRRKADAKPAAILLGMKRKTKRRRHISCMEIVLSSAMEYIRVSVPRRGYKNRYADVSYRIPGLPAKSVPQK